MEKEKIEQMEQVILSTLIDGRIFELDLKSPERKECFDLLVSINIFEVVPPEPTDLRTPIVSLQQAKEMAKANTRGVRVRIAVDWREKWERWRKENENTGGYPVQDGDR